MGFICEEPCEGTKEAQRNRHGDLPTEEAGMEAGATKVANAPTYRRALKGTNVPAAATTLQEQMSSILPR